jgi:hypothetical protein
VAAFPRVREEKEALKQVSSRKDVGLADKIELTLIRRST